MSSGTQTTTQQQKPLPFQSKLFKQASDDAMKLYNSGGGMNYNNMVVPWSKQTMGAMDGIMGSAQWNANNPNGISNQAQDIIGQGGFNDYQQGALRNMQGQLGNLGANGLSNSQDSVLNRFQNQMGRLGGNGLTGAQDAAMQNYRNLANSDYRFGANPGSRDVLNSIQRDVTQGVNANAAAAGRYGGGMHQGRLAQDLGDTSSQFRMADYNQWLGRSDAANRDMASLGQQGLQNVQGMGNSINALGQQGVQNRQGLSNAVFNGAQTGLGNMTSAYQAQQSPYQSMMGVGSMNEDLRRRTMDEQARLTNLPWEQIMRLQAVGSGMGNYSNTTSQTPAANPFLQTLGMGASIGGSLFGSGGLFS